VKFGLLLECDQDFGAAVEQTLLAEQLGYDSIFLAEHHNFVGYVPQPLIALSALATRTQRVELGTFIMILPLYNPVQVAEEAAMVDFISGGRLILGIGLGYVPDEFESYAVPYAERAGRMEEAIPLLKRLWTTDDCAFEGRYYRFSRATVYPKPVRKGLPPIWVGGWVEPAIRRAARLADCWVPGPTVNYEALQWCYGVYRHELARQGRTTDGEYAACRELFCAPTGKAARELGGENIYQFYKDTYLKWPHPHLGERERSLKYEDLVADRFILGDPDDCIAAVERFSRLGIRHFLFRMQQPGVSQEATIQSLKLFMSEVVPHFRDR
jgi:probable F420-dependent oxidoreductase